MASASTTLLFRFASIFALTAGSCHGLQLGENAAQITARHGAPAIEDHSRHLAVYFWEGWSAQLEFKEGVVRQLTYRRNTYLAEPEIQSLLQANGGLTRWRETTGAGSVTRRWLRDDGALATTDAPRASTLIFQTESNIAAGLPPVADSLLKFEAPSAAPALQPLSAQAQDEPVHPSGPQPQLRSETLLREQAARPEIFVPEPETTPLPVIPSEKPPEVSTVAAPPVAIEKPSATVAPRPPRGMGSVLGVVLAVVVLLSGMAYRFFRKAPAARPSQARPPATPPPVAKTVPREPAVTARPSRDWRSLRADQIELLLGEIFRREGYTVEISAAPGADGRSDLTLRRDGESIPVESREWTAERVSEREVREFYSLMASTAAPRGILVTTGAFSREARVLAAEKAVELIDRAGLDHRLAGVQRPDENFFDVPSWIEDFTASARIFDPECHCCGQAMAIRRHRLDGSSAWNCITHPRCAGRRETRPDLLAVPITA